MAFVAVAINPAECDGAMPGALCDRVDHLGFFFIELAVRAADRLIDAHDRFLAVLIDVPPQGGQTAFEIDPRL